MICPDCGSESVLRDSDAVYCRKCGLEIDDIFYDRQYAPRSHASKMSLPPRLNFKIDPKKELFALKLGLKHNKLTPDYADQIGFKVASGYIKPELKEKALNLIQRSFQGKSKEIEDSLEFMTTNWREVDSTYWNTMEKILGFRWQSLNYSCYLSLICNGGFHNSSKNFIIVQHRWRKHSSYVIAHELFHIIFRDYVKANLKEPYDDLDEDLSEVLVNFILLGDMHKTFPSLKLSLEIYALERHKKIAKKLWGSWKERKDFKSFMTLAYKMLGLEKTILLPS